MFAVSKGADLNLIVQGGQWYNAFPFSKVSLVCILMDKHQETGSNLGHVFNFRSGRVHYLHFHWYEVELPNLK